MRHTKVLAFLAILASVSGCAMFGDDRPMTLEVQKKDGFTAASVTGVREGGGSSPGCTYLKEDGMERWMYLCGDMPGTLQTFTEGGVAGLTGGVATLGGIGLGGYLFKEGMEAVRPDQTNVTVQGNSSSSSSVAPSAQKYGKKSSYDHRRPRGNGWGHVR